ncbi:MAG: Uma2 family endonuclease, partial [Dehalococcoidia bacterium]|nr:Uma2 family endonuclease [Dehalococcoidia bacterium]
PATPLPTLESGDHLTAAEFHARYEQRPDLHKAELIDGVVYVASPTTTQHSDPHSLLGHALTDYRLSRAGLRTHAETTILYDDEAEVRPDLVLRRTRSHGGAAYMDDRGYLRGAPELVAEIAASSASYDLHEKKALYRRMGVREYIVWRVENEAIDWWAQRDGDWQPLPADENGVVESEVFPGLRIDVPRLLRIAKDAREAD